MQKLVRLEDVLHERVDRPGRGGHRGGQRHPPQPRRPVRPEPADRLVPVPRPHRRRQDRAGPRARRLPVRRRAGHGPHRHVASTWRSTPSPASSARLPATSATTRAASSPRRCGAGPYSVVLLDEIEKAHPDVFNVLLQVLDDGRLTDGQGRTVDFTNVVLIMTSNLPGDPLDFFKPEFVNRIDEIVRFRSLTEDDLAPHRRHPARPPAPTGWPRAASRSRSPTRPGRCSPSEGYDPAFGARPLKRVIQRELGDRLAIAHPRGQGRRGRHRHRRRRRRRHRAQLSLRPKWA